MLAGGWAGASRGIHGSTVAEREQPDCFGNGLCLFFWREVAGALEGSTSLGGGLTERDPIGTTRNWGSMRPLSGGFPRWLTQGTLRAHVPATCRLHGTETRSSMIRVV